MAFLLAFTPVGAAPRAPVDLYADPQSTTALVAQGLEGAARADALALAAIPTGAWLTHGSPDETRLRVQAIVDRADAAGKTAVLVAYNIPLRDCSLYSAGGAPDTAGYLAWIRAFAAGIGNRSAIVILEPDSLGVIPWHKDLQGNWEACRLAGVDRETSAQSRFTQLGAAVDILSDLPRTRLYLDGTTSSWLAPGEAAVRLTQANIAKADGFFLNVSNFENDERVTTYARWLSDCLTLVSEARLPPKDCPSQYYPATFENTESWKRTSDAYDAIFAKLGIRRNPATKKRAVIDTSRNGLGSWIPQKGKYRDAEVWCNPPGRGLGRRPTTETGLAHVDAFLWIKIPGESDGECYRGTAGPKDPERGILAPPAGDWFADQARELIRLAVPPLGD